MYRSALSELAYAAYDAYSDGSYLRNAQVENRFVAIEDAFLAGYTAGYEAARACIEED